MKISLYNTSTKTTILLEPKIIFIGRDFFSSSDKRIGRAHGQITVLVASIKVKATHTNPIFYKKHQSEFQILHQNEEVSLENGHFLSLLPNEHIYEIQVTEENLAGNIPTLTTSSDFEIRNIKNDGPSSSNPSVTGSTCPEPHSTQYSDDEMRFIRNGSPLSSNRSTPDLDTPQPCSSRPGEKRSASEDANENTIKKKKYIEPNIQPDPDAVVDQNINQISSLLTVIKPDPDAEVDQNINKPFYVMPVIIKPDPDGPVDTSTNPPFNVMPTIKPDPDGASSSTNSTSATTVKTEPVSTNNPSSTPTSTVDAPVTPTSSVAAPVTPTARVVCQFGIRCYRHNAEHRSLLAHPGDSDYRRPDFVAAPADAPDCEYGAACYRRNPQHFSEFQHLPPSSYQSPLRTNIIAQRPRNIDNNIQIANDNRPDRGLLVPNYEDDNEDDDIEFASSSDDDYQRERNDRTSSDDEENNCEE